MFQHEDLDVHGIVTNTLEDSAEARHLESLDMNDFYSNPFCHGAYRIRAVGCLRFYCVSASVTGLALSPKAGDDLFLAQNCKIACHIMSWISVTEAEDLVLDVKPDVCFIWLHSLLF